MSNIALEMDHVYKKFRRGEIHDSLRDLIPAIFSGVVKKKVNNPLLSNEFWALDDISFQVNKGEALGIIGSNGAGKSTMLKLLSRIMKPTKGSMKVNGTLSALIEVGAGFHGDLTGRENIYLNGTILGMKKEQIRNKFDEIVEFSGLADFIDTPVKRYSSGMYARLGFAVAAHVDPEILVVDEVLSVGDYAFQNKCIEKMRSIFNAGATLLFVSHNVEAVANLCHRCILLDHGKIKNDGPATAVVHSYLNPDLEANEDLTKKEVYISDVKVIGESGNKLLFDTGEKIFINVEITGNVDCSDLSLSIAMTNGDNYPIFDTSTQRLGEAMFSLKSAEKKHITFELNLHLVPGTYSIGTYIYRYDIQKMYDARIPAAKIQVKSEQDVRGIVNLYPKATIK